MAHVARREIEERLGGRVPLETAAVDGGSGPIDSDGSQRSRQGDGGSLSRLSHVTEGEETSGTGVQKRSDASVSSGRGSGPATATSPSSSRVLLHKSGADARPKPAAVASPLADVADVTVGGDGPAKDYLRHRAGGVSQPAPRTPEGDAVPVRALPGRSSRSQTNDWIKHMAVRQEWAKRVDREKTQMGRAEADSERSVAAKRVRQVHALFSEFSLRRGQNAPRLVARASCPFGRILAVTLFRGHYLAVTVRGMVVLWRAVCSRPEEGNSVRARSSSAMGSMARKQHVDEAEDGFDEHSERPYAAGLGTESDEHVSAVISHARKLKEQVRRTLESARSRRLRKSGHQQGATVVGAGDQPSGLHASTSTRGMPDPPAEAPGSGVRLAFVQSEACFAGEDDESLRVASVTAACWCGAAEWSERAGGWEQSLFVATSAGDVFMLNATIEAVSHGEVDDEAAAEAVLSRGVASGDAAAKVASSTSPEISGDSREAPVAGARYRLRSLVVEARRHQDGPAVTLAEALMLSAAKVRRDEEQQAGKPIRSAEETARLGRMAREADAATSTAQRLKLKQLWEREGQSLTTPRQSRGVGAGQRTPRFESSPTAATLGKPRPPARSLSPRSSPRAGRRVRRGARRSPRAARSETSARPAKPRLSNVLQRSKPTPGDPESEDSQVQVTSPTVATSNLRTLSSAGVDGGAPGWAAQKVQGSQSRDKAAGSKRGSDQRAADVAKLADLSSHLEAVRRATRAAESTHTEHGVRHQLDALAAERSGHHIDNPDALIHSPSRARSGSRTALLHPRLIASHVASDTTAPESATATIPGTLQPASDLTRTVAAASREVRRRRHSFSGDTGRGNGLSIGEDAIGMPKATGRRLSDVLQTLSRLSVSPLGNKVRRRTSVVAGSLVVSSVSTLQAASAAALEFSRTACVVTVAGTKVVGFDTRSLDVVFRCDVYAFVAGTRYAGAGLLAKASGGAGSQVTSPSAAVTAASPTATGHVLSPGSSTAETPLSSMIKQAGEDAAAAEAARIEATALATVPDAAAIILGFRNGCLLRVSLTRSTGDNVVEAVSSGRVAPSVRFLARMLPREPAGRGVSDGSDSELSSGSSVDESIPGDRGSTARSRAGDGESSASSTTSESSQVSDSSDSEDDEGQHLAPRERRRGLLSSTKSAKSSRVETLAVVGGLPKDAAAVQKEDKQLLGGENRRRHRSGARRRRQRQTGGPSSRLRALSRPSAQPSAATSPASQTCQEVDIRSISVLPHARVPGASGFDADADDTLAVVACGDGSIHVTRCYPERIVAPTRGTTGIRRSASSNINDTPGYDVFWNGTLLPADEDGERSDVGDDVAGPDGRPGDEARRTRRQIARLSRAALAARRESAARANEAGAAATSRSRHASLQYGGTTGPTAAMFDEAARDIDELRRTRERLRHFQRSLASVAVSPTGQHIVVVGRDSGGHSLHLSCLTTERVAMLMNGLTGGTASGPRSNFLDLLYAESRFLAFRRARASQPGAPVSAQTVDRKVADHATAGTETPRSGTRDGRADPARLDGVLEGATLATPSTAKSAIPGSIKSERGLTLHRRPALFDIVGEARLAGRRRTGIVLYHPLEHQLLLISDSDLTVWDVAHLDVAAREVARTSERNAAAAAIDTGAGATASGLIPSPGKDTS